MEEIEANWALGYTKNLIHTQEWRRKKLKNRGIPSRSKTS